MCDLSILKLTFDRVFPDCELRDVSAHDDFECDGDPTLRMKVVFDPVNGGLDPRRASTLVRSLRAELALRDISEFPVMTFVSVDDADLAA